MLSNGLNSKAASTPHDYRLLVLLVSSTPWIPGGKVQATTPKGALTKLKAKPWHSSWNYLPLNIPPGFPDSFPHSSGTKSKTLAGRHVPIKRKLLAPLWPWATLADRRRALGASLPSLLTDPQVLAAPLTLLPLHPKALTLDTGPTHCSSSLQGLLTSLSVIICFVRWVE